MRKIVFSFLVLYVGLQINAQTDIPEGNINGIWTKSESPYRIMGDVTIGYYDSLIVEAGVIIDFEGHYKFKIQGVLNAHGTIGDTIRFTRRSNDGLMNPDTAGLADTSNQEGSWNGIEWGTFLGSVSNLSHCIFEFINTVDNTGITWDKHRAPFHYQTSGGLNLYNSVIRNNYGARGGGIWAADNAIIDSCLISNNTAIKLSGSTNFYTAGGIVISAHDYGEVTNCVITNNSANWQYAAGGMRIQGGNPLIMNNIISNNISNYTISGAGGIYCAASYPRIIQNLIVNNESPWVGGIHYDAGGGVLYNNTICNNKSRNNLAGGIRFEGSSGTIAMNNIIYGNEYSIGLTQILLVSISSQPVVMYNLIGNSMEEIQGNDHGAISESDNYFGDPSLQNPTGSAGIGEISVPGDWQLGNGSVLINQGNNDPVLQSSIEKDMAGNRRINYGHVDPGCFEFRIESYTPDSVINSPEIWIADTVHITRQTELKAKVSIYPGTVILSHGHFTIHVQDTLYAIGTAEAPILWTMKDTTGFSETEHEEGGWGPITVHDIQPRIFRHCVFEFGKIKRPSGHSIGLIWGTFNGNLEIDNCIFRNNHAITSSLVYSTSGANYTIKSSSFFNNKITPGGEVIYFRYVSNLNVRDNLIFNNDCFQDLLYISGANIDFINNSIYNNTGSVILQSCFNINIVNNTILNNTRSQYLGGGDNARIINTIFPDLHIGQEGYEVISSHISEEFCMDNRCSDLMTDSPVFKNPLPYSGVGPPEEVLQADYSLANVSPGINSGSPDTSGLKLSKTDISGNPRINDGRIDIGAYENQGSLPVISGQPVGGTFCVGDNHTLNVVYEGSDTVNFDWFKDGSHIIGENENNILELDSILISDEGNYHCEISNSYGKVLSTSVYIKVNVGPNILVQPETKWHKTGEPMSMSIVYTGSSPITFQWEKDGEVIPGKDLPEYRFTPADSSQEGNYICTVSNSCDTVKTNTAALYLAPQICMVTVSATTGHNLIVWEKKSRAPILAYNIYRESVAAGIYDMLATVAFEELSVFVDSSADPTVQAYLYKITALDTSNKETDIDLCRPHKTIHLLVTTNPELNSTQLAWDRYYGFDYQTYTIYRSNTGLNFDPVHSLSASLNSWTDPSPIAGDAFYRMAVEKPDPCVPEGGSKKAGTGPYQHALSNMDDNKLKAGEHPPDSMMLDNYTIDENLLPGSLVGRLITRDEDTLDYYTYHLVSGDGDEDNGSFSLIGDLLISATTFDYETRSSYTVRIRTTDNSAFYLEKAFTITINDKGEGSGTTTGSIPPETLNLDNNSIPENNLFGDLVGRLKTVDKDTFDVHTYQLVIGTGDDDNAMFMILGDMLMAAFKFDYETKELYTIRVRSTDLGNNFIEKSFTVNIGDADEPAVGINGIYTGPMAAYPNPFSNTTTIRFNNPSSESYQLLLMDLSGKICRIIEGISGTQYVLKRENLRKGLYFLELRGPQTYRTKLVID